MKQQGLLFPDDEGDTYLSNISLQIQLAATAVATSFLLIFIPNVETISFTAFLVGFIFPFPFAMATILTMTVTWEILASMVFAFSGITFPFKVIAWTLIGGIGMIARKVGVKYFYEFAVLGAISAFLFDIIVTTSTALLFLNNQGSFLTVLVANLLVGFLFTISHTISNALLFSFIPVILRTLLPLLYQAHSHLVMISSETFDYLNMGDSQSSYISIALQDKTRLSIYGILASLIIVSLVFASISQIPPEPITPADDSDGIISITLSIDYDGIIPSDSYNMEVNYTNNLLEILKMVANVSSTTEYGQPFITGINGVIQNQNLTNHYWLYFIDDQYVNTGAVNTYLENNDQVEFRYQG